VAAQGACAAARARGLRLTGDARARRRTWRRLPPRRAWCSRPSRVRPSGCVFRQAASRREPLRLARAPKPRDSACDATAGHAASAPHALLALFCAAPSVWPLGVCQPCLAHAPLCRALDVVQSLIDDDMVSMDKIGTSNFYWSLKSEHANKVRPPRCPAALSRLTRPRRRRFARSRRRWRRSTPLRRRRTRS
jgi:hypothetical protein